MKTLNFIRERLPSHKLELRINAQVILLRNLSGGLCNGTRLNINNLYKYNIEAVILTRENIHDHTSISYLELHQIQRKIRPFHLHCIENNFQSA